jgi:hypothetical protein
LFERRCHFLALSFQRLRHKALAVRSLSSRLATSNRYMLTHGQTWPLHFTKAAQHLPALEVLQLVAAMRLPLRIKSRGGICVSIFSIFYPSVLLRSGSRRYFVLPRFYGDHTRPKQDRHRWSQCHMASVTIREDLGLLVQDEGMEKSVLRVLPSAPESGMWIRIRGRAKTRDDRQGMSHEYQLHAFLLGFVGPAGVL